MQTNSTKQGSVKKIGEYTSNEFDTERAIEKESLHDSHLRLFETQKARERK